MDCLSIQSQFPNIRFTRYYTRSECVHKLSKGPKNKMKIWYHLWWKHENIDNIQTCFNYLDIVKLRHIWFQYKHGTIWFCKWPQPAPYLLNWLYQRKTGSNLSKIGLPCVCITFRAYFDSIEDKKPVSIYSFFFSFCPWIWTFWLCYAQQKGQQTIWKSQLCKLIFFNFFSQNCVWITVKWTKHLPK